MWSFSQHTSSYRSNFLCNWHELFCSQTFFFFVHLYQRIHWYLTRILTFLSVQSSEHHFPPCLHPELSTMWYDHSIVTYKFQYSSRVWTSPVQGRDCDSCMLHGIKPVRLNGSFDSKCTRPETSHLYQSFTIPINTSTGIIVDLNNLRFKWHNKSRHQTVKQSKLISQKMRACRRHNHMFTKVVTPSVNAHSNISLKWMDFRSATYTHDLAATVH